MKKTRCYRLWLYDGSAVLVDAVDSDAAVAQWNGEPVKRVECLSRLANDPPIGHCPDCGAQGERKGHMTCQYPQD